MSSLPVKNEILRKSILPAILELDNLYAVELDDKIANQLLDLSAKLHEQLVEIMRNQLTGTSEEFEEALISLEKLTKKLKKAQEKLEEKERAINKAAQTIEKIGSLISGTVGKIV